MICPNCYGKRLVAYDTYRYNGNERKRYRCKKCDFITANPLKRKPLEHIRSKGDGK